MAEVDSALCLEGPASLKKEGDAAATAATAGPTCGDILLFCASSSAKLLFDSCPFKLLAADAPGSPN